MRSSSDRPTLPTATEVYAVICQLTGSDRTEKSSMGPPRDELPTGPSALADDRRTGVPPGNGHVVFGFSSHCDSDSRHRRRFR